MCSIFSVIMSVALLHRFRCLSFTPSKISHLTGPADKIRRYYGHNLKLLLLIKMPRVSELNSCIFLYLTELKVINKILGEIKFYLVYCFTLYFYDSS